MLYHQDGIAQVAQALNVLSRRRVSRGCSPMEGSSSTYSTPIRREPTCVAKRMRCASPPESVLAERYREIIQPHIHQKPKREVISLKIRWRWLSRVVSGESVEEASRLIR